jgi:hypothetical protein
MRCLAKSSGFQDEDKIWLYHLTQTKGKSPKLQLSWEGHYRVIVGISSIVYRVYRMKMVVHFNRLTLRGISIISGTGPAIHTGL